jgi:diguanylate cyclase (GGDEF)-like protein
MIFRNNYLPQYSFILFKILLIAFVWMAVQFHLFTSSFFPTNKGRWLPLAFFSLALMMILIIIGYIPESLTYEGGRLYPQYGTWFIIALLPLLALVTRNVYVFISVLRNQQNLVVYNQAAFLLTTVIIILVFGLTTLLPFGKEFPLSHLGNVFNAIIFSYAIAGNQLVDIRFAFRRGLMWLTTVIVAVSVYWLLLYASHFVFKVAISWTAILTATMAAIAVLLLVLRFRGYIFTGLSMALEGQGYKHRRHLLNFANRIHSVFSLKEQAGELLSSITKALNCQEAGLLFSEFEGGDFIVHIVEPPEKESNMSRLRFRRDSPVVAYLEHEHTILTRENLKILPDFLGLWEREKNEIESSGIELFLPLVSRDNLIGILVLGKKAIGKYKLEDLRLVEDVANLVAVSIEKEYLREQLKEREEEISIINRSSAIFASDLNIQSIYNSFIKELKKIVWIDWATISIIEKDQAYFLAVSSDTGYNWQPGSKMSIKGSGTEWVALHKKTVVESDLTVESRFTSGKNHIKEGIRSIVYLPLVVKNEVIGCLILASRKPNAYNQRNLRLLEQLASQIAMPIENSRLYSRTAELARNDELTGLLNRRSLNEWLINEIGRHTRYGGVFSLLIFDIDSFKSYNDSYGHLVGDEILKQVGENLRNTIRETDQAFRYGGDEFSAILPQTSTEAAFRVAERIRQQIYSRVKMGFIPISVSLGLASWPSDGITPEDIIAAADAGLYQAKHSGGNCSKIASRNPAPLDSSLSNLTEDKDREISNTIFSLAATVDSKDQYDRNHSKRVKEYALAMGDKVHLSSLEITRLANCAILHDIGKIGVNDDILNKPGKLTEQEFTAIKMHPVLGAAIIRHSRQLAPCIEGILHHHERYDGSGYPDGLKGDDIPLESRILMIADSFSAMTSDRCYAKALPFEQAIEEIKRCAGTQFDPTLVDIFLSVAKVMIPAVIKTKKGGEEV